MSTRPATGSNSGELGVAAAERGVEGGMEVTARRDSTGLGVGRALFSWLDTGAMVMGEGGIANSRLALMRY